LNSWLDFVRRRVPGACLLCGSAVRGAALCPGCAADLPRPTAPGCAVCAEPLAVAGVCGRCLQDPPGFDDARAACLYRFPADVLVQRLKYGADLACAAALGELLADAVAAAPRPDLLLPMPLHPARLRERGFNQAAELARPLARRLGVPLAPALCRRLRDTPAQASLDRAARRRNVRGAFACDGDLSGRHVAVVDDVLTSGATIDALARALKKAGAARVSAWVATRAPRD
jgi:ComF family protein